MVDNDASDPAKEKCKEETSDVIVSVLFVFGLLRILSRSLRVLTGLC